jgi:predicted regulator of Ras-like GTPase activity (Roadblock/LC7/MglB family)
LNWKGLSLLSIDLLLNNLVESIDGATGAIIVAVDGEAVQWGTSEQNERLRLRSAYVAVVMQTFRAAAARAGLGQLKRLVVGYKGATLIAQEIDDDCCVMLELKASASVSRAVYQMQTAVAVLRQEITA